MPLYTMKIVKKYDESSVCSSYKYAIVSVPCRFDSSSSSRGECDVLRLVACPRCLLHRGASSGDNHRGELDGNHRERSGGNHAPDLETSGLDEGNSQSDLAMTGVEAEDLPFLQDFDVLSNTRKSSGIRVSLEMNQIGVVADPSEEEQSVGSDGRSSVASWKSAGDRRVFCYTVERCLQAALLGRVVYCPRHGNLGPFFVASDDGIVHGAHVAPDSVCPIARLVLLLFDFL